MDYSFFGIQVVIAAHPKDQLRRRLHDLLAETDHEQTPDEKRSFYKRFCALVNESMPVFELGFWDLLRSRNAEDEFETWCSEIEGSMATEAEELGTEADEVYRLSTDKDYIIVTLLFLMVRDGAADRTVGRRADVPEAEWNTRQTFAQLIATAPLLDFETVRADAVYLMPGNDDDGISSDDLYGGDYKYLRMLS
jgi:hypothetical protein